MVRDLASFINFWHLFLPTAAVTKVGSGRNRANRRAVNFVVD
jgi:hypothetical protein